MLSCNSYSDFGQMGLPQKGPSSSPELSCKSRKLDGFWTAESELESKESGACPGEEKPWTEQYLKEDLDTPSEESVLALTFSFQDPTDHF